MSKILKYLYNFLKKVYEYVHILVEILCGCILAIKTIFVGERENFISETEKKILIMGNGPSLKDTDIDKVANEVTDIVCVNYFPLKDDRFFVLKPQYLCLFDPAFFRKSADNVEVMKSKMLALLEKVDWPLIIITVQNQTLPVENTNISYSYLCKQIFPGIHAEKFRHFLYRKNLVSFGFQNVVIGASFYFVSKRVKEIYLAGVDMSEFKFLEVDVKNEICVRAQHHYGSEKFKHSELGVIKKGEFYKLLSCYVKMFEQFYFLERYAVSQGVKIYNLSPNSFIDVFEKRLDFAKQIKINCTLDNGQ